MEPWLQYSAHTSTLSRELGRLFNISPAIADHMITGFGGSHGRSLLSLYDMAQADAPEAGWDDVPITRRFIKDASKGSQSISQFWDLMGRNTGQLQGKFKSWEALMEGGNFPDAMDLYAGMNRIEKGYTVISTLPGPIKRLHPLRRAQAGLSAISEMRRELMDGTVILHGTGDVAVSAPARTAADDVLSSLSMAMARNALVTIGQRGWQQRELMDEEGYYRELEAISPDLKKRLKEGYVRSKVTKFSRIVKYWPEVEKRLLEDGSNGFFDDLKASVETGGFALGGFRPPGKTKKPKLLPDRLTTPR